MFKKYIVLLLIFFCVSGGSFALVIYRSSNPQQVALTFDDGPTLGVTDKILDILKEENVKATFFVIGRKIGQNPEIIKRMAAEGHEIGNHSYSHEKLTSLDSQMAEVELRQTSNLITNQTGRPVNLYRPPHGALNYEKRKLVENRGYDVVMWSVNADDFLHENSVMRSPISIVNRIMSRLQGGDIVLMHDNSRQIVEAMPQLIKKLKARDRNFVTISQLLGREK
ncbi:MAG: polysaccharide deacetylase family protein [bacterium]